MWCIDGADGVFSETDSYCLSQSAGSRQLVASEEWKGFDQRNLSKTLTN